MLGGDGGRPQCLALKTSILDVSVQNTRAQAHQTLTSLSLFDASPAPSSPAC